MPPADGRALEIWTFDLDLSTTEAARLVPLLSHDERRRADRRVRPEDGQRFRVAHGRLREILGHHLGVPPQDITFGEGPFGKPYIAAPETSLRFNLTHSDALGGVVLSHSADVGIDIERIRTLDGTGLETALSAHEQSALAALDGCERRDAFFRCWTRKEAVLKAHGCGLAVPLESFDVPVGLEPETIVRLSASGADEVKSWRIVSFVPAPGYAGAVAAPVGGWHSAALRYRTWPKSV